MRRRKQACTEEASALIAIPPPDKDLAALQQRNRVAEGYCHHPVTLLAPSPRVYA